MSTILSILNQLEATSSRKAKEAILEENKLNETLKRVLQISMDPRLNFYIKKFDKIEKSILDEEYQELTLEEGLNFIVDHLATRRVTGNAARVALQEVMEKMSEGDREVLRRVILRDLRCGVKVPTVNKIFGDDFVHIHPVMLCDPFSTENINRMFASNAYVILQLKADGARVSIAVQQDSVVIQTRSGEILDMHGRFDFLKDICPGYVIDGEFLTRDDTGKIETRKISNGIMNSIGHGTASKEDVARVFMKAWDMIPYENWVNKIPTEYSPTCYEDRLKNLDELISKISDGSIEMIETHRVKTIEEANAFCANWMANEEEGGIFKTPDLQWENKRSKNAIKVKAERTGEFRVLGFEYGREGKQFEGMLGALIVGTDDGKVLSNVGSGFSQKERETWLGYDSPEAMIEANLIVELTFNEVIKAGNRETYALFLPRFNVIRTDKKETNTLEELQA